LVKEPCEKYSETTMNDLVKLTKGSDLAGISLMTNWFDNAIQITQKLRNNCDFPILWGGIHATIRPEESLDHADMVCIGEGEETIVELADKIQNKQYYHDVKGMGFDDKGKIIVNESRALPGSKNAAIIKSLDQIPFQDYDYKNHFVLKGENIVRMDAQIMEQCTDMYVTLTTRGCPFGCTFCINNFFLAVHPHQKPIRKRSVDHIIKELLEVKANLPHINKIKFDDDAFFLHSLNDMKDFAKQYKEKIKMPLIITGATPSTLKRDKLDVLVDAGLTEMRMGIQTAGERTKVLYKRPHTNEEVENAVIMVNDHKDKIKKVFYDIILDSPWDTEQDNMETLMFLSKLPTPYVLNLFSLVFYPGTDLYRKAKKEGIVKNDINDIYHRYYHGCKPTYLNSLHSLLHDYVSIDIGISPKIMALLINKKMRLLKLNWILFWILKMLNPLFKIVRFAQQVLRDVLKGNWSAVKNNLQIYKWYQRKKARIAYDFFLGLKKISNSIKMKS